MISKDTYEKCPVPKVPILPKEDSLGVKGSNYFLKLQLDITWFPLKFRFFSIKRSLNLT